MAGKSYYWGATITEALKYIIQHNFTAADYSVLIHLISEAEPNSNIVAESQENIVDNFVDDYNRTIDKSTVSRSINKLIKHTLIVRPKDKTGFMINPSLFYIGGQQNKLNHIVNFAEQCINNGIKEHLFCDLETNEVSFVNSSKIFDEFEMFFWE